MLLIANKDFYAGRGRHITTGQQFECPDKDGYTYLRRGIARFPYPEPAPVVYETKVILPVRPAQDPAEPFRHLHLSDEEPVDIPAASDPVLPEADVPAPRTPDRRGRGRRKKRGAK